MTLYCIVGVAIYFVIIHQSIHVVYIELVDWTRHCMFFVWSLCTLISNFYVFTQLIVIACEYFCLNYSVVVQKLNFNIQYLISYMWYTTYSHAQIFEDNEQIINFWMVSQKDYHSIEYIQHCFHGKKIFYLDFEGMSPPIQIH